MTLMAMLMMMKMMIEMAVAAMIIITALPPVTIIHIFIIHPNPIERNSSAPLSVTFFTHLPSHATKHGLSARRA